MKICIVGSFSTGKTTLSNDIKKENKNTNFLFFEDLEREIAKEFGKPISSFSKEEKIKYQQKMIDFQIKCEKEISMRNINIFNNSLLTILAYCKYSFDRNDYIEKKELIASFLASFPYTKVFYLPIEFQIENDGVRHIDLAFQKLIDDEIKNLMKEFGINYVELSGNRRERMKGFLENL